VRLLRIAVLVISAALGLFAFKFCLFLILNSAFFVAFLVRLFSVLRFESVIEKSANFGTLKGQISFHFSLQVIHEFDPYFNYRTTRFLAEKGFYNFHNWFDDRAWYPLGRIIGGTIYPGLMVTSAVFFNLLEMISMPVNIRNVCVFLAPAFSSLTTFVTYLLTKGLFLYPSTLF